MLLAGELVDGLNTGDRRVLAWLRRRVDQRARHRFSAAAWSQISEDFLADLTTQLLVTTGRGGFALHGSVAAYVDVSIVNLCKRYSLRVARARRNEPLSGDTTVELVADSHLVRIAQALEVEEIAGDQAVWIR